MGGMDGFCTRVYMYEAESAKNNAVTPINSKVNMML